MSPATLEVIFHPSDFTEGDTAAFLHALRIAVAAKAHLHLLHVEEKLNELSWSGFPHVRQTLCRWGMLPPAAEKRAVEELGLHVRKVQRVRANTAEGITQYIEEHHPDLVVLATHQRQGLDKLLHPSIAQPLARRAHAPVLFVPRGVQGFVNEETGLVRLRNILVPVDRSPNPQAGLEAAAVLGRTLGCGNVHFSILHIGSEENRPNVEIPEAPSWTSEYRTWKGDVVRHILDASEAEEADLVVLTTHGHHGFLDALRGGTTEKILQGVRCPVLAVPTDW